jgi:6-hydroxycyclohex-1-ene-1-carbonyl-CoA dehydrogenase
VYLFAEDANMANMPVRFEISAWRATAVGEPLRLERWAFDSATLRPDEVAVRVAGCGVCHTDLGFLYDGVRTGRPFPLTLGHEIAGRVEAAGAAHATLLGRAVVVPAVLPCGECALCRKGRGQICRKQLFPGSDVDGGFASHVIVPGRGLCLVDETALTRAGLELPELAVLADAVSTPYQAIVRTGLGAGDVAIVVGAGGVGGFAVQIARALGAHVVAIDVDEERLALAARHGAELTVRATGQEPGELKKLVQAKVKERGWPPYEHKIFECSGRPEGQLTAFALLGFGATLSVVGYTLEKVGVRLANLMAFDAVAQGNWGCLPELYPAALELILDGKIALAPFVERRPMSAINDTFGELKAGALRRRPVLVPDFTR